MSEYHLEISNIHCGECITSLNSLFSNLLDPAKSQSYSINNNSTVTLRVPQLDAKLTKKIIGGIQTLGFDVIGSDLHEFQQHQLQLEQQLHSQNCRRSGIYPRGLDFVARQLSDRLFHFANKTRTKKKKNAERESHLKFCKACQEQAAADSKNNTSSTTSSLTLSNDKINDDNNNNSKKRPQIVVSSPTQFRALFKIDGMTCALCSNTIQEAIINVLKTNSHNYEVDKILMQDAKQLVSINIFDGTGNVIVSNKQLTNAVVEAVNNSGYDCKLMDIQPIESSQLQVQHKVTAIISGMSCVSCSNTIVNAVKPLPFVDEVAISHMSKTGVFILNNNDQDNVSQIRTIVEDAGYGIEIQSVEKLTVNVFKSQDRKRTILLKISGMYCQDCPKRILACLSSKSQLIVDDKTSAAFYVSNPFIKFTYTPNLGNNSDNDGEITTVRSIINDVQLVSSSFKIELVKAKSLNEELIQSALKEIKQYLIRLSFTFLIAIPTFVIGIVPMSLLKNGDSFKKWAHEAIIAGRISRLDWILFFLATPVYFFIDYVFHRKAFLEVRTIWRSGSYKQKFLKFGSMNLLISLGTTVSYFASITQMALAGADSSMDSHSGAMNGDTNSYFDSVVFLTFFILIGKTLESISKYKTNQSITNLNSLKLNKAHLISDNQESEVDVQLLEVGDLIKVYPGQSPPVDAIIIENSSKFDENSLTGESTPIEHKPGDQIFAGTINVGSTTITCKVASLTGDSLLDQIIRIVRDGQMSKATESQLESTIDTLMGYFVPTIVCLAIITWIVWLGLGYGGALPQKYLDSSYGGWAYWSLEFAIAVFVIACPCGIGLVAPTALFTGSGIAARNGILARGSTGSGFQEASGVNVICFDKTGTLTKGGDPKVVDHETVNNALLKHSLAITKDLESNSNHPLSKGIKSFIEEFCKKQQITLNDGANSIQATEISGKGVYGKYPDGKECIAGNEKLLSQYNGQLTTEQLGKLSKWKNEAKSIVILAVKENEEAQFVPWMLYSIRDEIREEAAMVIETLQQQQQVECWMISGDNELTAKAVAREVGIKESNVISEVLPEEKLNKIKYLKSALFTNDDSDGNDRKKKDVTIAMVGDGINDAPALAVADVGIALASGSELAVTSADFILLNKKYPLLSILTMLKLSKKVFRRIKFSFGWAIVYNVVGIPIAAGVVFPSHHFRLSPIWASAAMAASSVSVVLSGLALNFFKVPKEVVLFQKSVN